jgi:hypothetical protein
LEIAFGKLVLKGFGVLCRKEEGTNVEMKFEILDRAQTI